VIPSKLGYKGVLIQNPKGLHGLPRQLAIYGGVMEVGVDRKAFLADPGRQLESALLSMAIDRKAIPENVAKRISEKGLQ
jgi:hypothetical protein